MISISFLLIIVELADPGPGLEFIPPSSIINIDLIASSYSCSRFRNIARRRSISLSISLSSLLASNQTEKAPDDVAGDVVILISGILGLPSVVSFGLRDISPLPLSSDEIVEIADVTIFRGTSCSCLFCVSVAST